MHRDLPNDILAGDGTCTITAWAVNGDDEVVSSVVTLKVWPIATEHGAVTDFYDDKQLSVIELSALVPPSSPSSSRPGA